MQPMAQPSPQPGDPAMNAGALPSASCTIHIDRDEGRLLVDEVVLWYGPRRGRHPAQVRWVVEGELLPDEVVLIYSRPLEWTGPHTDEQIPLACDLFPETFLLNCRRGEAHSGPPRLGDRNPGLFACSYGVVLMRGDDEPLRSQALIKVHCTDG